jgi:hypothetical protein
MINEMTQRDTLPRIEDYRADLTAAEIADAQATYTRSIAMLAYLHAFPAFLNMRQLTEFIQGRRYIAPNEPVLGGWFLMRQLADTSTATVSRIAQRRYPLRGHLCHTGPARANGAERPAYPGSLLLSGVARRLF